MLQRKRIIGEPKGVLGNQGNPLWTDIKIRKESASEDWQGLWLGIYLPDRGHKTWNGCGQRRASDAQILLGWSIMSAWECNIHIYLNYWNNNCYLCLEGRESPYLHGNGFVQRMCSTKHFCSVASSCKLSLSSSSTKEHIYKLNKSLQIKMLTILVKCG